MGVTFTTYYGLVKVNNVGPEALGWAVTDYNFDTISLLFKQTEIHRHGGATPIHYPGYNDANPATPTRPVLTQSSGSGVLSPGATVGVRLSYLNSVGLETDASPETVIQLPPLPVRANPLNIAGPISTPVPAAVAGGTYLYGITRRKNNGETQLSDVTTINVPFSSTGSYSIPLTFDPITTYGTDGTDSLRIYRAQGYSSAFALMTTVTDVNQTTYTDSAPIGDATQNPPTMNQFDKNKQVLIDWSSFSHPAEASALLVYVTQTSGTYGVNNLLFQWATHDLSTPLPTNMYYFGNEVLQNGWPKNFNQIPANPSQVNLGLDAYGGPNLTDHMRFNGYQAQKIVLANNVNNATPIDGGMYYDPSIPAFRARVAGNWLNLGTPSAGPQGQYVHPTQEQGGHSSDNILYKQIGGNTLTTLLNVYATPVAGGSFRKQATAFSQAPATPMRLQTNSTVPVAMVDMTTVLSPDFAGQMMELLFSGHISANSGAQTVNLVFEINGVQKAESIRANSFATPNAHTEISLQLATPFTRSNNTLKVLWWTNTGVAYGLGDSSGGRRSFYVKGLF